MHNVSILELLKVSIFQKLTQGSFKRQEHIKNINHQKFALRHIMFKLQKIKCKEKALEVVRKIKNKNKQ